MKFPFRNIAFLAAATWMITSCSNNTSIDDTKTNLQNGNWHVTYFVDSGVEETSNFNGYDFTFASGGGLTATNGSNTYTASWSAQDNSTPKLVISGFPEIGSWDDLNEDWHITSSSATRIEMEHVSGGNGGTDYLTLEKH